MVSYPALTIATQSATAESLIGYILQAIAFLYLITIANHWTQWRWEKHECSLDVENVARRIDSNAST